MFVIPKLCNSFCLGSGRERFYIRTLIIVNVSLRVSSIYFFSQPFLLIRNESVLVHFLWMREQYGLSVSKLISSEFVSLVLLILSSNSTVLYKGRITVFPLVLLNCFITGSFQHFNSSKIGFFLLLSHALHKLTSHLLLTILAFCICTFFHFFFQFFWASGFALMPSVSICRVYLATGFTKAICVYMH